MFVGLPSSTSKVVTRGPVKEYHRDSEFEQRDTLERHMNFAFTSSLAAFFIIAFMPAYCKRFEHERGEKCLLFRLEILVPALSCQVERFALRAVVNAELLAVFAPAFRHGQLSADPVKLLLLAGHR